MQRNVPVIVFRLIGGNYVGDLMFWCSSELHRKPLKPKEFSNLNSEHFSSSDAFCKLQRMRIETCFQIVSLPLVFLPLHSTSQSGREDRAWDTESVWATEWVGSAIRFLHLHVWKFITWQKTVGWVGRTVTKRRERQKIPLQSKVKSETQWKCQKICSVMTQVRHYQHLHLLTDWVKLL